MFPIPNTYFCRFKCICFSYSKSHQISSWPLERPFHSGHIDIRLGRKVQSDTTLMTKTKPGLKQRCLNWVLPSYRSSCFKLHLFGLFLEFCRFSLHRSEAAACLLFLITAVKTTKHIYITKAKNRDHVKLMLCLSSRLYGKSLKNQNKKIHKCTLW